MANIDPKVLRTSLKSLIEFLENVTSDCREEFEAGHNDCSTYGHSTRCFLVSGGLLDDEDVDRIKEILKDLELSSP